MGQIRTNQARQPVGVWQTAYTVESGNLAYFGIPVSATAGGLMRCTDTLELKEGGEFDQSIRCPNGAVRINRSGKWVVLGKNGTIAIRLWGMLYLFPQLDLEHLEASWPDDAFSSRSISVGEPERGPWDPELGPGFNYVYPRAGYVVLYPRLAIDGSALTLVHGSAMDERPPAYGRQP